LSKKNNENKTESFNIISTRINKRYADDERCIEENPHWANNPSWRLKKRLILLVERHERSGQSQKGPLFKSKMV